MCSRSLTSSFLLVQAPHNHQKSIFISASSGNNSRTEAKTGLSRHLAAPKLASSSRAGAVADPQCQLTIPLGLCFCLCVLMAFLPGVPLSPKYHGVGTCILLLKVFSLGP